MRNEFGIVVSPILAIILASREATRDKKQARTRQSFIMTYNITNTSSNPLKEDPELKRLLQELDAIDSKKKFRRWRNSFLQKLAGYVDEAHGRPAEIKYQEFTHSMGRMSTLVKKLYSHLEIGDLSEARTSVRARKCLSDLQQSMKHVNNHLFDMLPKTAEQEKALGYSKFHLGAVLVRDGFVEYDRLVVCDEILQHMATNGLQQVADRQILDNMDNYHDRLGMFCDVMADLGLYKVMLVSRDQYSEAHPLLVLSPFSVL